MKKTFGLIALLACSAAVTVSPAMANDRNNFNQRDTHTTYVADRDHDRRDNDRDRDRDRRDDVRYTRSFAHVDGPYCR